MLLSFASGLALSCHVVIEHHPFIDVDHNVYLWQADTSPSLKFADETVTRHGATRRGRGGFCSGYDSFQDKRVAFGYSRPSIYFPLNAEQPKLTVIAESFSLKANGYA